MKIAFTKSQWERASDILGNFGLLTIGSVVIPAIWGQSSLLLAILGVVATVFFWYSSIIIAKKY